MKPDLFNPDSKCAQAYQRWIESPQYTPINRDTVLAAARQHDRHLRAHPPRGYEMRVFEDGSVFLRNTEQPGLEKLFSLAEIEKAAHDFWMSPARPLWKHILAIWE